MFPANANQLEKIRLSYKKYLFEGNSSFKAAFLATSENGFIHTVYIDAEKKTMTLKDDNDFFVNMTSFEEETPIIIKKQSFSFTI